MLAARFSHWFIARVRSLSFLFLSLGFSGFGGRFHLLIFNEIVMMFLTKCCSLCLIDNVENGRGLCDDSVITKALQIGNMAKLTMLKQLVVIQD